MRTHIPARHHPAPGSSPSKALPLLPAFLASSILAIAGPLPAQTTTPQPAPHKTAQTLKRASATRQSAPTPQPTPEPVAPPAPPPPDWPANDKPADASVTWNSQGLRIEAANSSLSQILKEVTTVVGTKVEGLGADQRIFGTYGPGSAREVLAKLLDGSGYNVLMIGDQGRGTPRSIVLSSQVIKGEAPPVASNQPDANDDNADADEPPPPQPQLPSPRNGFNPGAPPRTPQQIMQEMQQRQQQQPQQPPQP